MSYRAIRQKFSSLVMSNGSLRRAWINMQSLPARSFFHSSARKRSWSEAGEDEVLLELAQDHLENGFYVDVGANLPTKRSNTFRLYCHGMSGVCVEPNLELAALFERARPRDQVVCAAVGNELGITQLHRFNYHVYSTCSEEQGSKRKESASARMRTRLLRKSPVPMISLRMLLKDVVASFDGVFFLLNTDTEGFDSEVLHSNDWEKFRPLYILTESTGDANEVRSFLEENDYELFKEFPVNQLFACQRSKNAC